MKESNMLEKNQINEVIPSINIGDFINKEKICDYVTEWHIANRTVWGKGFQTEDSTNNHLDMENQYPLFF